MHIFNSMGGFTFHGSGFTQERVRTGALEDITAQLIQHIDDGFLLLEGGADINPQLYGEERTYTHFVSDTRDKHEIMCFLAARVVGIPILGICRGHQLMAALAGGTLYQDVECELGKRHAWYHDITFTQEARTSGFIGLMQSNPSGCPASVNSMHHQAVKRVPMSATPLAYHVDGTPEALLYPWGLSVQWHPEFMGHNEFIEYMANFAVVRRHDNTVYNRGGRD